MHRLRFFYRLFAARTDTSDGSSGGVLFRGFVFEGFVQVGLKFVDFVRDEAEGMVQGMINEVRWATYFFNISRCQRPQYLNGPKKRSLISLIQDEAE